MRGQGGEERLRKRREFDEVFQKGRSLANKVAVLYFLRQESGCRVGFAAGRRLGGAVVRNRARRRLREAVRRLRGRMGSGWAVVLVARRGALEAEFGELLEAVESLFTRAGILIRSTAP